MLQTRVAPEKTPNQTYPLASSSLYCVAILPHTFSDIAQTVCMLIRLDRLRLGTDSCHGCRTMVLQSGKACSGRRRVMCGGV